MKRGGGVGGLPRQPGVVTGDCAPATLQGRAASRGRGRNARNDIITLCRVAHAGSDLDVRNWKTQQFLAVVSLEFIDEFGLNELL